MSKFNVINVYNCDAIKQNESELGGKNHFSVSLYASISGQYHAENHIKSEHTVPWI